MADPNALVALVAFLVVAGWSALAWWRKGRDPHYLDDASILLPAPPPAMTAATATAIAGGDERTAVLAALLDLASRDEIAFVAEGRDGRRDRVGIRFRGGETTDARVLLNRRRPIGEAESWLLGEMRAWHATLARDSGGREMPSPEMMAGGMQMFAALMRGGMTTADDDDSFAARAAREHGLNSTAPFDIAALERAYTAKTGKPFPDSSRQRFQTMFAMSSAMSDPAAVAADPDHYIGMIEQNMGRTLKPEERDEAHREIAAWAARATQPDPDRDYVPAAEARRLQATFLFGTLLQRYAQRHGWVAGLAIIANIKWGLLGAAEFVVGIAVAAVGNQAGIEAVRWLGGGVAAGGLATLFIARSMPALSRDGAVMKAQLAAYRRTLKDTFAQTSSLDQAVGGRLPWLETPDQALVWGVALGLRHDIEALLARAAAGVSGAPGAQGAPAGTFAPSWYATATAALSGVRTAVAAAVSTSGVGSVGPTAGAMAIPAAGDGPATTQVPPDPVAMFAGIEAIGSERTSASRSSA